MSCQSKLEKEIDERVDGKSDVYAQMVNPLVDWSVA